MHCNNFFKKNTGTTLIEIVVYTALLGVMLVFISNFLIEIVRTYDQVRAEREVASNARLLLEAINNTIAQASQIYAPTSRFNIDNGQLSLVTALNPQLGETTNYVDFWIDNGALLMKQDGQATTTLSAPSVHVGRLYVQHIAQGLGRDAVALILEVDSGQSRFSASTTLHATTVLRGSY